MKNHHSTGGLVYSTEHGIFKNGCKSCFRFQYIVKNYILIIGKFSAINNRAAFHSYMIDISFHQIICLTCMYLHG